MPPTVKELRLRRRRRGVAIALAAVLLLLAGFVVRVDQRVLAAGYVTAEQYAEVRPPLAGTIKKIYAQSGGSVKQGDLLVQLDNSEEQAGLEEAKSRIAQAEAELARRAAEITEEKRRLTEDIAVARLRLQNAQSRLARSKEMFAKEAITLTVLEDDVLKELLSRAELTALTNRDLSIYEQQLHALREETAARHDAAERADAACRAKEVRAPISGQALRYDFVIGELVKPEMALFEIFGGDKLILKLRIPERHASRVAIGNKYSAVLIPYRGLRAVDFAGRVEYLRNVIQSEGQQTYRIAFCSFDPKNYKVLPGTTAEARIYCGRTCLWFFLLGLH